MNGTFYQALQEQVRREGPQSVANMLVEVCADATTDYKPRPGDQIILDVLPPACDDAALAYGGAVSAGNHLPL